MNTLALTRVLKLTFFPALSKGIFLICLLELRGTTALYKQIFTCLWFLHVKIYTTAFIERITRKIY